MKKYDEVCELIAEAPETHGVFETRTETHRRVFCQVMSVSRMEYWRAKDNYMSLDLVFRLTHAIDYHDERWILYRNEMYRVERTYINDDGSIELTAYKERPEQYSAAADDDNGV